MLEGIVPSELHVLFVKDGFVGEAKLQSLIINFNYGLPDQNSKLPFTSFSNSCDEAAEARCSLRCLPIIFGSRIPEGNEYYTVQDKFDHICTQVFQGCMQVSRLPDR
jgi:hypothetical protein